MHEHDPHHHDENWDWNLNYSGEASDHEPPDELLLQIITELPPGRVLDIGCGAGGMVIALAERGWRACGVDIAKRAIASTRKTAASRDLSVELHCADATTWTPTDQYDVITSSFALPFFAPERVPVFAMAREALVPGGLIALKDFDPAMAERHRDRVSYDGLTTTELTAAFQNFEVLRAEVVDTPAHDHDGSGRYADQSWTATLFVARKPA